MNFTWIFLGICLIKGNSSASRKEYEEGRGLSTESHPMKLVDIPSGNNDHGIKLQDLVPEKESTSIQDHFSVGLISTIQKVVTDLISNPQAISFLLALIPAFPPAAIIGSFAMVVLSILQNPTILKFLQGILSDLNPFANSSKDVNTPKYLKDFDGTNTDGFNFINEGVKYGSEFADSVLKELNWKSPSLQELDSLKNSQPQHKSDKKHKSSSQIDQDESDFLDQLRSKEKRTLNQGDKDRKGAIPLLELH